MYRMQLKKQAQQKAASARYLASFFMAMNQASRLW